MRKVFLLLFPLLLVACASEEQQIRAAIEEANTCATTEDCVMIPGKCPFDCYILSNKSAASSIAKMVDEYESTCMYSCIEPPSYTCEAGKCEFKRTPCDSHSLDTCPAYCQVCPPSKEGSSLGCHEQSFCQEMGFTEEWSEQVR
jgi:hypothetical protein